MQGDTVWVFDPSHQFDFILNCCLPLSFEGSFLHEGLDCYSAILAEIVSQVDCREVSSPDLPLRLEKLVKVLSRDVPQQQDLPFLAPRPEISLQSYLCFSKEELQSKGLPMFALDDRKVECKLERDGPILVPLDDLEFTGVEVEISELSFEHEGVGNEMFGVVGGLESCSLLTLHCISIRQISKSKLI